MAEASGPTSCPSSLALESKLSRSLEVQSGLVPKLSILRGKTPRFALKNHFSRCIAGLSGCAACFQGFC